MSLMCGIDGSNRHPPFTLWMPFFVELNVRKKRARRRSQMAININEGDWVRTDRGNIFQVTAVQVVDEDGIWFKSKARDNSVMKTVPEFFYNEGDEKVEKISKIGPEHLIIPGDLINYYMVREVLYNPLRVIVEDVNEPGRLNIIEEPSSWTPLEKLESVTYDVKFV